MFKLNLVSSVDVNSKLGHTVLTTECPEHTYHKILKLSWNAIRILKVRDNFPI